MNCLPKYLFIFNKNKLLINLPHLIKASIQKHFFAFGFRPLKHSGQATARKSMGQSESKNQQTF